VTLVDRSKLPEVGPDPAFHFPAVARSVLPNGLHLCTVEHPSVPVITFMLLARDGSASDPAERHGLASITADMLDEGSGDRSAIEMHEALARIGAEFDTDVGADASSFTLTTLTRFAADGATLLADMVVRPRVGQEDLARVRRLRLDRLVQLRDLAPAVADRSFARLLYRDHPYGHLSLGSDESLGAMTREDVVRFHDSVYRPERVTIIVVGATSHDEMRRLVEHAFGTWAPGADPGTARHDGLLVAPPIVAPERLAIVAREGAAQSELRIGHVSVSRDTPDYHALLVLNAVVGGQFVSRVNLKLREEKGYTYGARTWFEFRRGPGPFVLQVSVQSAVTAEAIGDALEELDAIRGRRPVAPAELSLARTTLTRGYPRGFETTEQVARSVAQLVLYALPDDYFEQFVPRVNAVDPDTIARVASQYIDPARLVTLIVGDPAVVLPRLPALGLGEPIVLQPI